MLKTYVALFGVLEDLKDDPAGTSLVEYAVLVALLAALVMGALNALSDDIGNAFNSVGDRIRAATAKATT